MIIAPFNSVYFLLLFLIVALAVGITLLMKNKSDKAKEKVLIGICLFNLCFYVVYKLGLYFRTPGIPADYLYMPWKELPLHLCNISLMLVPIGIARHKDFLLAYGIYIAPLGAVLALSFPETGFHSMNLFYFHMIGYYGTHAIIILVGILSVSLGLYKPTMKKILPMFGLIVALSLGALGINLLIRQFTGTPANYFYVVEPMGISILELFWSWIPVPYLYCLPGIAIFAGYSVLITLPFALISKKKTKKFAKVA